jgi:hypothetical protein
MTNVTGMPLAGLSATGTASATTYLRGDNSWQTAGSTSASDLASGTLATARMAAGSIVQVSADTTGTSRTDINVGNGIWTDTVVTAAFTPTVSGSDVIVSSYFSVYGTNTAAGDLGFAIRYKRAISGGATTYPTSLSGFGSGNSYGSAYFNYGGELHWTVTPILLDSPSTDAAITYTLQCSEYNAEGLMCGAGQGTQGRWHIWFMEVKR